MKLLPVSTVSINPDVDQDHDGMFVKSQSRCCLISVSIDRVREGISITEAFSIVQHDPNNIDDVLRAHRVCGIYNHDYSELNCLIYAVLIENQPCGYMYCIFF